MTKPKTEKKAKTEKKFYGEIISGYDAGEALFEFNSEKECDEAMQNEKELRNGQYDGATCSMCEETIEPKKRFIAKVKENANRSEYMLFCSQECFDDYFNVDEHPEIKGYFVDPEIKEFKERITEILKP
jgi:hypothetical protein